MDNMFTTIYITDPSAKYPTKYRVYCLNCNTYVNLKFRPMCCDRCFWSNSLKFRSIYYICG